MRARLAHVHIGSTVPGLSVDDVKYSQDPCSFLITCSMRQSLAKELEAELLLLVAGIYLFNLCYGLLSCFCLITVSIPKSESKLVLSTEDGAGCNIQIQLN